MPSLRRFLGTVFGSEPRSTTAPLFARTQLGVAFLEDRVVLSGNPTSMALVGSVDSAAASILNKEVIAFDVTTVGRVSYNVRTGTYSAKIELPGGASLDATALKTLMAGQLALPKVNPVQALSALGGLTTQAVSEYDTLRANFARQYGSGNVYFSSRAFTDWASAENFASTVAAAVLTGGSTTGQIIQEAKDVLLNELGNLYTWLQNKLPAEADAMVAAAFKAMVTGQPVETPYLAFKFVNVKETYTIGLGGAAATLAAGLGSPTSTTITSSHKGFAVIWKGPGTSLDSLTKSLNNFVEGKAPGASVLKTVLNALAQRPELKGLGKVADAVLSVDLAEAASRMVVDKLSAALGVTKAQLLQLYKPGNAIIDLTALNLDEKLAGVLGNLAAGNQGTAKVTKLEFNLNTYEFTAEVQVRHRHSWGSVSEILGAVGKKIGQWVDAAGNVVRQQLDAAGNTLRTLAYKGADTVRETFNKAGSLIAKAITNSAGYKTLEQVWTDGVKTLDVVRDRAGRLVSEYWRVGTDEFRRLYTNGARTAYTVWKNGINTLHNTYNTLGTVLTKYWVDGTKQISQWYTNGKATAENVIQNGVKIAEKTWVNGVNTLNRVRDDAGKLVSEYWRNGTQEFRRLYTNGERTAYTVWNNGVNTVHYVYTTAGQFVSRYWVDGVKQISQWYTDGKITAENIVQNGVRIAEKMWKDGITTLNRVRDTAGRLVSVYWRDGAKEFKNVYENGKLMAQNIWENGVNIAQHVWNSAGNYIGNALNNAGSAAGNAWNKFKSWF